MKEQLLSFLVENQNPDGGWGYIPPKKSALEPTAYAVMCLQQAANADDTLTRAMHFIIKNQTPQGGWPINTTDREPAVWVSPLVGIAILAVSGFSPNCQSAASFVLNAFGKMPKNWLTRISEWLGYNSPANVNTNLGGWSWNPGTSPWVEPTCYSLLFLKMLGGKFQADSVRGVIAEGETLIYDRVCKSGGWNYGNAQVLGEELRPYPLTTALALMALQDRPSRVENQKSLAYLGQALPLEKSALSLCFAGLCLDLYSRDWQGALKQLTDMYHETQFMHHIKTCALALLVLQAAEGRNFFRNTLAKARETSSLQ